MLTDNNEHSNAKLFLMQLLQHSMNNLELLKAKIEKVNEELKNQYYPAKLESIQEIK